MTTEIRVPQLPESVADATLVAWHKQPGDTVSRDENLADLETDKVVLEVPAPMNGVIKEIRIQSGTTVTSGQVLAVIDEAGAGATAKPIAAAAKAAAPAASASEDNDSGKLSPSVRRLVEENKLDPAAIPGSGKDGRLTKSDVVGFLGKQSNGGSAGGAVSAGSPAAGGASAAPGASAAAQGGSAPAARAPSPGARPTSPGARSEQRVPMTRLRQRIAQRLIEAQST